MVVICKKNMCECEPLVLPQDCLNDITEDNYLVAPEWYTIDDKLSGYRLTPEKIYIVYGLLFFKNQNRYLLMDDNHIPGFFPSELFRINDTKFLSDWKSREYIIESNVLRFVGYPALCESYDNLIGLIGGESHHIEMFLCYKEQLLPRNSLI